MTSPMTSFGIVSFAHVHAGSYAAHIAAHPDARLAAVWDDDRERGQAAAARFGAIHYADLAEFLASGIDAVIVCSENSRHYEHVLAAATAGKAILCEKPLAVETAHAERMIRFCAERQVVLSVAFPVRYAFVMQKLKEIADSGALGDIVSIHGTNRGKLPGGWFVEASQSGGGAAIDHIVHLADVYRWLLRSEVRRVYAELDTRFHDIAVEDCGIVLLEFENGTACTIDPSWNRPASFPLWSDFTMEVIGTRASLSVDALKQASVWYGPDGIELKPWMEDPDKALIDDFIACVRLGKPASVTGRDGLQALNIVKAAYESNALKQFRDITS